MTAPSSCGGRAFRRWSLYVLLLAIGLFLLKSIVLRRTGFRDLYSGKWDHGQANSLDSYYKILELDPSADRSAIKKAYRSLSMKYHPDKNSGDRETQIKFDMVYKA